MAHFILQGTVQRLLLFSSPWHHSAPPMTSLTFMKKQHLSDIGLFLWLFTLPRVSLRTFVTGERGWSVASALGWSSVRRLWSGKPGHCLSPLHAWLPRVTALSPSSSLCKNQRCVLSPPSRSSGWLRGTQLCAYSPSEVFESKGR